MSSVLVAAEAPPPRYGAAGADADATSEALAQIDHWLGVLGRQVLGGTVPDSALEAGLERLHRLEARLRGEKLRWIGEVDSRQAAAGLGARSTSELLAGRLGLTPREATSQTSTAKALAEMPETAEGLRDGRIGVDQANAAARVYQAMDTDDDEVRREFDRHAARQSRTRNATQVKDALESWAHQHGSDHLADRDQRAFRQRRLRRWIDEQAGLWRADMALPLDMGAVVDAALDALLRRERRDQQREPGRGGRDGHDHGDHGDAGGEHGGSCDDAGCADASASGDGRSFAQRQADALVAMAQQTLNDPDLPTIGGAAPHVLLVRSDDGTPADLDGVGAISDATADQLTCDAIITAVARSIDGDHQAGRTRREPTTRQRAEVIVRDRRCIGCGAPAMRCQVHHIIWCSDGGLTVVENLALVCWSCHHHIHHHGWTITGDHRNGFGIDRTGTGPRLPAGVGRRRTP